MKKQYLGDGVYVEIEDDMIKLTTDINTIYLEQNVFNALVIYETTAKLKASE